MSTEEEAVALYVALSGDDTNPGSLDAPLATLAGARDAARDLVGKGQAVEVLVREGVYYQDEPLLFTPQDSGSAQGPVT